MHTIGTKAPDTSNLAPLQKLQAETVFMSGFQMSMSKVLMETVMGGSVRGLSERDPGAGGVGYRRAGVDRAQAGNHPRHQRCVWQHRQLLGSDFFWRSDDRPRHLWRSVQPCTRRRTGDSYISISISKPGYALGHTRGNISQSTGSPGLKPCPSNLGRENPGRSAHVTSSPSQTLE